MGKPSKAEKQELNDFIKKYNEDYVLNEMPIDDYIIGKGNKTSFCYFVEGGISFIGIIAGITSFKFGIYYGKTKNDSDMKYRFDEKLGKTLFISNFH